MLKFFVALQYLNTYLCHALQYSDEHINPNTQFNCIFPAISALINNEFAIVWQSFQEDSSGWGIFSRIYNSEGNAVLKEFKVNNHTHMNQENPTIAAFQNGSFLVAWQSENQDGSLFGIYASRFDINGIIIWPEFLINTYTQNEQEMPSVAIFSDQTFIVVWQSMNQVSPLKITAFDIYAGIFNTSSNIYSQQFLVNTVTYNMQINPKITIFSDDTFIIVWQSFGQAPDPDYGIFFRRFQQSGTPIDPSEQIANSITAQNQTNPAVGALSQNEFVIVWQSFLGDGNLFGVMHRSFTSSGIPKAIESVANIYTLDNQEKPALLVLPNSYIIAWQSLNERSNGYEVYFRQFSLSDFPITGEIIVNSFISNDQVSPQLALLPNQEFIVVWSSFGQDDDTCWGVYGKRFSSNGNQECFQTPCLNCFANDAALGGLSYQCQNPLWMCQVESGHCSECYNAGVCYELYKPRVYCDRTRLICVECLPSQGCSDLLHPVCNLENNICVECLVDSDCQKYFSSKPFCDTISNTCQICIQDIDCPYWYLCSNFQCLVMASHYSLSAMSIGVFCFFVIFILIRRTPRQFYGFVRVFQTIYYMIFIGISWKDYMVTFFSYFSLSRFDTFPSIFSLSRDWVTSPAHFNYNGYPAIFLIACGSLLTFIIIIMVIGGILKLFPSRYKLIIDIKGFFSHPGLIYFWIMIAPELTIGTFLQLFNVSLGSGFILFSLICAFLSFGLILGFPIYCFKVLRRTQPQHSLFRDLTRDVRIHSWITKYIIIITYLKRVLSALSFVLFAELFPVQQVAANVCLSAFYCMIIMKDRPRRTTAENNLELYEEAGFLLIYLLLGFIIYPASDTVMDDISKAVIVLCIMMLIPHLVLLLVGVLGILMNQQIFPGLFDFYWSTWNVRFIKREKNRGATPLKTFYAKKVYPIKMDMPELMKTGDLRKGSDHSSTATDTSELRKGN